MKQSAFCQEVDSELLDRLRRSERSAQEAVFRMFERPVYTLAVRICKCPDEALEVLQDTFILTFTRIKQFKGDAPFWGWLRQIAVNTCLARMRKLRRLDFRVVEDDASTRDVPEHQIDLTSALAQLPAESRTVVWLYDVEGYSHQEIARMFGKSISFSKTQLSRAHARLRDLLNRDGGEMLCTQPATI